ncbi:NCAN [Bugula neritina]|uniref:NCAN n=1 Tax=Bugula neritina TaxID=10212 RepID=A0A7J7KBU8_BUGNE|nr:NCAN [Bugula neritina]
MLAEYEVSLRDYWIGYHYDAATDEWVWFGDETIVYSKWHKGYPELSKSCARITISAVWKDRDCEDLMPYVCKKPTMCESPPVIANGGPDVLEIPELMDVGKNITYKCRPGSRSELIGVRRGWWSVSEGLTTRPLRTANPPCVPHSTD